MTMRELTAELMREHGFTEEEIKRRNAAASIALPGAQVDRQIDPAELPQVRARMRALLEEAKANPEFVRAMLDRVTRKLSQNN